MFELNRGLAGHVRDANADGVFPVVLAGDCNSCLGTVAGCGARDLGVVWFDAHADFDTPEDSRSGSFDGMGLAMLTGRGWDALRETIPGLAPIPESHVVLVSARDLEQTQRDRLQRSRIRCLEGNAFSDTDLRVALDELRERVRRVYLHIDLDALDPGEGTANQYSAPDGLSSARLQSAVGEVFDRFHVVAAAITAYNPLSDADGRMADTATRLLTAIVGYALPNDG